MAELLRGQRGHGAAAGAARGAPGMTGAACKVCEAAESSFAWGCGLTVKRGVKVKMFSWSCDSR